MLLLDSVTLIWLVIDSPRLGETARARLTASPVYASSVSIAELTIKAMLGKLTIPDDLPAAIRRQGLTELPLTSEHAAAMTAFPELVRHDPFDRLLLAQAQASRLDLLTPDRVLLGLGLPFVIDAAR